VTDLKIRDTQTRVKHEILQEYLEKWGYIICEGLRGTFRKRESRGKPFKIKFVYIDCFSYTGRYQEQNGTIVFGSPIIGIQALSKLRDYARAHIGFSPDIISILIEKERREYDALLETLNTHNYGPRIKTTTDFSSLGNEEIAVVRGDFHNYLNKLLEFSAQEYTWAFYLLDTYGPMGIPLSVVAPIISQQHTDVMINFPYMDLHRKSGSAVRNDPEQEKHNRYNDEMYGDSSWRQIAEKYYREASGQRNDEMESSLVHHYKVALQTVDKGLSIKSIRLKFPDMERTMFYLFLTTHDPTGALALNEILADAKYREFELREQRRRAKMGGQLSLFAPENDPGRPISDEPDIDYVANLIYGRCKGEKLEYREVLRRMIDEPYFRGDIGKAMRKLKGNKQVNFEGDLRNSSVVTFSK
jgi:three-Cys-motif partner protein